MKNNSQIEQDIRSYAKKLEENITLLEQAKSENNSFDTNHLQRENEFLVDEISHLQAERRYGNNDHGGHYEKARKAVSNAIKNTIDQLLNIDDPIVKSFASHLRRHISTGTKCIYKPDRPINWHIKN